MCTVNPVGRPKSDRLLVRIHFVKPVHKTRVGTPNTIACSSPKLCRITPGYPADNSLPFNIDFS